MKRICFPAITILGLALIMGCGGKKTAASAFHVYSEIDSSDVAIGDIVHYQVWAMGSGARKIEFPPPEIDDANITVGEKISLSGEHEGDVGKEFALTFWDTGSYEIPPYAVQVLTEGGGEVDYAVTTDPAVVTVHSLISEEQPTLRDIKPPVPIPTIIPWEILLSLVGIALAAAALVWMWRRRLIEKEEKEEIRVPTRPPYEIAMEKLDALRDQDLTSSERIKRFYVDLSYLVREYLEYQYFVRAIEMTTSEIEDARHLIPADQDELEAVTDVLKRADLAKFARFQPKPERCMKDLETIDHFLRSTRQSWTTVRNGVKTVEAV